MCGWETRFFIDHILITTIMGTRLTGIRKYNKTSLVIAIVIFLDIVNSIGITLNIINIKIFNEAIDNLLLTATSSCTCASCPSSVVKMPMKHHQQQHRGFAQQHGPSLFQHQQHRGCIQKHWREHHGVCQVTVKRFDMFISLVKREIHSH